MILILIMKYYVSLQKLLIVLYDILMPKLMKNKIEIWKKEV